MLGYRRRALSTSALYEYNNSMLSMYLVKYAIDVHRQSYSLTALQYGFYAMKSCLRISPTLPNSLRPSLTLRRSIATHTYSHHAKQLSILPTNVDTSSSTFRDNASKFNALMSQMEDLHRKIKKGGTEKAREKHLAKGKMLVREYANKLETFPIHQAPALTKGYEKLVASPP